MNAVRVLRARFQHTWPGYLLAGALVVYLFTRLAALADYPIYFFTDEAVQTLLAQDFLRDGLHNYAHDLLPTYFQNVYQYNLGVSVYLQVLPALWFERSIELTRGIPALISALAPLWLALALRQIYPGSYYWLAALILASTPAWFLHSRTAFEAGLAVTFYTGFLYAYVCYRGGRVRAIYAAVLLAALAFYAYSPAQVVVVVSALLFFLADLRYHWQNRAVLARAAGLGLLCALPYLRFQNEHPAESLRHLEQINSYWVQPGPLLPKIGTYLAEYLRGLNPVYWYAPGQDIARHVMGEYSHLGIWTLPLGLGGAALAAWRIRRWQYRVPLLALLAAPSGAAVVGLGVTRALFLVVPAALLCGLLAAELLEKAGRRWRLPASGLGAAAWVALAGLTLLLLGDALRNGPTWSTDYGLAGMQYGARQVFGAAAAYTRAHPGTTVYLTPTWTNGADVLARYLVPASAPVHLEGINSWLNEQRPLDDKMCIILTPEELDRARESEKFSQVQVESSLPYPDGRPGFFFTHLRYVDGVDEIFAAERAASLLQLDAEVQVEGQPLAVHYSRLDMGEIRHIFDGDLHTFVRTLAANPLVLRLRFSQPRTLSGLALQVGGTASTLDVAAWYVGTADPRLWHMEVDETPDPRRLGLDFGENLAVTELEIRLKNTHDPEPGHVHLWELSFLPAP